MANRFMEMRKRIEVLERLDKELDYILKDVLYSYECVKETPTDEQATDWKGNLLWEDAEHTVPKMRVERDYDYVPKKAEDVSDEDRAMRAAVEDIRKALLKLV